MKVIKVKKEKYPERCEICHKKDCFDGIRNYCVRCYGVEIKSINLVETANIDTDVFGRPPIIAYLDLQASRLEDNNINDVEIGTNKKILSICIIKGFKIGVIVACVIYSIPSFLLILYSISMGINQVLEMFLALFAGFFFALVISIFVGAGIGFLAGIIAIIFNFFRKFLSKKLF